MKLLSLCLSLLLSLVGNAQNECAGLETVQVSVKLYLNGQLQNGSISKSTLLKSELQILVDNNTHHLYGFTVSYDCHSGVDFDISSKDYFGNTIPSGDKFLKGVWIGDHLVFDCFILQKNRKRFTIPGIMFKVVD